MNIRKSINRVLRRSGYLIADWAEGQFGVRRILRAPTKGRYDRSHGIVIQRFENPDVSAHPGVPHTASRAT